MSSRITFVTAAGAVALGLLCGPTVSALRQDVTLSYRWTKGETVRYRIVQQSTTTISGIPGGMGDMAIDQSTTQVMATVAEEVTPDAHDAPASHRVGEDGDELSDVRDVVRQRESRHRRQSHERHAERRLHAHDRRVVHARDGTDR